MDELFEGLGLRGGDVSARDVAACVQAKGAGYAISRDEELRTIAEVARATGVITDHVYSGKALHALLQEMKCDPGAWDGKRVLFVHTGGVFGLYERAVQLQPLLQGWGTVGRGGGGKSAAAGGATSG